MTKSGGATVRGERYLNKSGQFSLVYDEGKSWAGKDVVIRALPNRLETSRFGFVVSRRVGKAVVRNRVKRRLREITRQSSVQPGWDIVLIARITAATRDYNGLKDSVGKLLLRAGLITGENESNRPVAN